MLDLNLLVLWTPKSLPGKYWSKELDAFSNWCVFTEKSWVIITNKQITKSVQIPFLMNRRLITLKCFEKCPIVTTIFLRFILLRFILRTVYFLRERILQRTVFLHTSSVVNTTTPFSQREPFFWWTQRNGEIRIPLQRERFSFVSPSERQEKGWGLLLYTCFLFTSSQSGGRLSYGKRRKMRENWIKLFSCLKRNEKL